jgi:membrane-bound lytic murein transglycosylase F
MQVRPVAAREVGEVRYREPEANLRAGTRYLKHLEDLFRPARGRDRLALMLAAYNMGPAHVFDAQELAQWLGYDPFVWDGSMDQVIQLLELPRVYRELPNGYAQGRQVVAYVDRILERLAAGG